MKLLKNVVIVSCLIASIFSSCDIDWEESPGYRFGLFKDTPVWELAKAVKHEDTVEIRRLIKEKHLDVNYQIKPHWGTTLLMLAVGNDKLLSVMSLLNNGARLDIADNSGNYPIHYIVDVNVLHSHRLEILELLLKHGADPNTPQIFHIKGDTTDYVRGVPLMDATSDLECTKILLRYGANMNYRVTDPSFIGDHYQCWLALFGPLNDIPRYKNIFVAKYLIVDLKLPFPDTLFLRDEGKKNGIVARTSLELINEAQLTDPERQKAKEEILAYLKAEGYPKNGALRFY